MSARLTIPDGWRPTRAKGGVLCVLCPSDVRPGRYKVDTDVVLLVPDLAATRMAPKSPRAVMRRASAEVPVVGVYSWRRALLDAVRRLYGPDVTWAASRRRWVPQNHEAPAPVLYGFARGRLVAMVAPAVGGMS